MFLAKKLFEFQYRNKQLFIVTATPKLEDDEARFANIKIVAYVHLSIFKNAFKFGIANKEVSRLDMILNRILYVWMDKRLYNHIIFLLLLAGVQVYRTEHYGERIGDIMY